MPGLFSEFFEISGDSGMRWRLFPASEKNTGDARILSSQGKQK
jgi:hypothetical protein